MSRKDRCIARSLGRSGLDTARTNPRSAEANSALALAIEFQRAGESAQAEVMFSKAVTLNPKSAAAHHGLGFWIQKKA
jgi:Tfp pilus assembly protein PilF